MNTHTMARTSVNPAIVLLLAASLLANVALAVVALNASSNSPAIASQPVPAVLPKVYVSERSGEGLVGSTSSRSVATLMAYTHPYAGEGRSNVAALRAIDALPLITFDAPLGMGEGWVGGVTQSVTAALVAHTSCGQGEGLVQHGVPVENPCRQDS